MILFWIRDGEMLLDLKYMKENLGFEKNCKVCGWVVGWNVL